MKRILATLLLVAVLSLLPVSGVLASSGTDEVGVTATGEYISFTAGADLDLGTVVADTTVWANGSEPTWPLTAGDDCYFTVDNISTVETVATIGDATAMSGGGAVDWTCSVTATPGADTFGMKAGAEGCTNEAAMVIVLPSGGNTLMASVSADTDFDWELEFLAPTTMSEAGPKVGTVTLTLTAA